jgi:hypothetical protein
MTTAASILMWAQVAHRLRASAPGTRIAYAKRVLPHPRQAGAHVSVGLPVGQHSDYRFSPDGNCRGLHVHEYADRWVVHLDQVHPDCDVVEHLRRDAPGTWCLAGAAIGAAAGAALGKNGGAVLAGAGIGLLLALAACDSSPQ